MKLITRIGKGVIGAVVSIALFIGCLPITAQSVAAATAASLDTTYTATNVTSGTSTFYSFTPPVSGSYRINVGTSSGQRYAHIAIYATESTRGTEL